MILAVEDLGRAAGFYCSVFAWPVEVEAPVYVEFALPGGMRLGFYDRRAFAANTKQTPHPRPAAALASTELYLYPLDLEAVAARLHDAGARCLSPLAPRDWGEEAVYFADPDGNVLVLARAE